ncbi:DUF4011 domain-containing protein [Methylocapsa palsarum]|uniref:AAA domain-containing protein n=1 Tax=Methylocapsa palsarum TaxID=1612308 RepID=A0A1I3XCN9_9HYPH|nr:DUF4011 domain-containing protein [Methylocapsa palsarum]SFK17267.1 AAA domain-containing protein [Methylocapsa palsarum]
MGQITSIKAARKTNQSEAAEGHLEKSLAEARHKLIETGTRNRLIHTPRGARRTRSLSIAAASSDAIFATLVRDMKPLRFASAEKKSEAEQPIVKLKAARAPAQRAMFSNGAVLQTALSQDSLQNCLRAIHHDAITAEEERGVNILFLAIGFLRWFEDENSDVARHAPLVLVPVNLLRDAKRETFELKFRDDEITTNRAIQERLRSNFGVMLPGLPEGEDWLPRDYFADIVNAVALKRRWSVDFDGLELGFYSFSKMMMMMRDLDPANWPGNTLIEHPLLRGVLCEGFPCDPPALPETARLDEILKPRDIIHVVEADSSQTCIVETVRAGRNLVVQGPPGTGKSQTITNIIAGAVHSGKSVLFVAEKMAALNVVHDRLAKAGLEDICLELHSRTLNKRLVADRLNRTLQTLTHPPADDDAAEQLTIARDRLNHVAERLHSPIGDTGMTPYQSLAIQIASAGEGVSPDIRIVEEALGWDEPAYEERRALTLRLADVTSSAGPLEDHVYFGVRNVKLQPNDFNRLVPKLKALAATAEAAANAAVKMAGCLGYEQAPTVAALETLIRIFELIGRLPQGGETIAAAIATAPSLRRIAKAAAAGVRWRKHKAPYHRIFHPAAWTTPVEHLRGPIARGAEWPLTRLGRGYREAARTLASLLAVPLPRSPAARMVLVEALIKGQALSTELVAEARLLADVLGDAWRGKRTDFVLIHAVARTIEALRATEPKVSFERITLLARIGGAETVAEDLASELSGLLDALNDAIHALDLDVGLVFHTNCIEKVDLGALARRAALWAAHPDRFAGWVRLANADGQLRAAGPAAIADALGCERLDPALASRQIETAFAEACWKRAVEADPDLGAFEGAQHRALIDRFAALENLRRDHTMRNIKAKHQAAIPRGAVGAMGVIRDEIGRKRNHMPLRKLMRSAGDVIQKIKPVFLMSPLSVAEFLPPGSVEFDLLVIDEASQMRPVDALGLIARSRQIVVVGDAKQLPPTRFFDRLVDDDVEPAEDDEPKASRASGVAPAADLESILTLCEARGLETRMLRWHYRSRHPSLIEVSNAEFYHRLIMPPAPAPRSKTEGLVARRVAGAYDRGGLRTNVIEAEAIADAAAEHARTRPRQSLGIITFSTVQRNLIADRIEARRRGDPVLDAFLRDGGREEAFVKNLENVQGDEREVILISICYGPRDAGQPLDSMAFGPISTEGGERRVNVLFTRARTRCEVFVSFGSGDINLERATGEGPRVLKRFLHFAETGILEQPVSATQEFDSPFEATVAAAIENMGYKVDPQVGSAGFKIDLAVRDPSDPGRYMLAVECDGATYHSALWARERDRLRQQVLEGMGWRIYRIWSTDWFYRRGEQLEKLKAALDAAKAAQINKS